MVTFRLDYIQAYVTIDGELHKSVFIGEDMPTTSPELKEIVLSHQADKNTKVKIFNKTKNHCYISVNVADTVKTDDERNDLEYILQTRFNTSPADNLYIDGVLYTGDLIV